MPPSALLLALLAAAPAQGAQSGFSESVSPHFQLYHQSAFGASGLTLQLERIHNRLRLDLSMFVPWMAKERVKIYLYSNRNSYVSGEFHPPSWSNGIAFYDRKLVCTYEQASKDKLLNILGHELTHLFFESYWGEEHQKPPAWLNEGLAMLEETDPNNAQDSDWYQSMSNLTSGNVIPLKTFLTLSPTRDMKDKNTVALWYVQAYSVVHFLYRRHSRQQFFNFCSQLRQGKDFHKALWLVYRYPSAERFEAAWKNWLKLPETQKQFHKLREASAGVDAPSGQSRPALRSSGFSGFTFRSLLPQDR
ncbi:MAG TPA: hypothetical protein DCM05_15545 [Elusimicrobia bacterium]|nr:hypothetical protein [Elusimicrobiota bacterium]